MRDVGQKQKPGQGHHPITACKPETFAADETSGGSDCIWSGRGEAFNLDI